MAASSHYTRGVRNMLVDFLFEMFHEMLTNGNLGIWGNFSWPSPLTYKAQNLTNYSHCQKELRDKKKKKERNQEDSSKI